MGSSLYNPPPSLATKIISDTTNSSSVTLPAGYSKFRVLIQIADYKNLAHNIILKINSSTKLSKAIANYNYTHSITFYLESLDFLNAEQQALGNAFILDFVPATIRSDSAISVLSDTLKSGDVISIEDSQGGTISEQRIIIWGV